MCDPITIGLALGGLGLASQYDQGEKARKAQQDANNINKQAAIKQADLADQANNKANARTADINGMTGANALDAKGGQSGTMLTGPQGVDPTALLLGKKTLLGG